MATSHLLRLIVSAAFVFALILTTSEAGTENFIWSSPVRNNPSTCKGTIAECMANGRGEFDMDTESNRRILATTNYISYGALNANNVPCSQRGASYYNCQPGAQANPSTRSCNTATQCRSS